MIKGIGKIGVGLLSGIALTSVLSYESHKNTINELLKGLNANVTKSMSTYDSTIKHLENAKNELNDKNLESQELNNTIAMLEKEKSELTDKINDYRDNYIHKDTVNEEIQKANQEIEKANQDQKDILKEVQNTTNNIINKTTELDNKANSIMKNSPRQ